MMNVDVVTNILKEIYEAKMAAISPTVSFNGSVRVGAWMTTSTNTYTAYPSTSTFAINDSCYNTSGTSTTDWRIYANTDNYYSVVYPRIAAYSDSVVYPQYYPYQSILKTPIERLKEMLNSRMAPHVISNCKPLGVAKDIREVRARETLLRVIGDLKFKDFIRRGFLSVRGKSGLVYQIFPGHGITSVYNQGAMVERLCVVLSGDFPPTDSLIMRYLLILNNEDQFRSLAIKHSVINNARITPAELEPKSLVEILKDLKKLAA